MKQIKNTHLIKIKKGSFSIAFDKIDAEGSRNV